MSNILWIGITGLVVWVGGWLFGWCLARAAARGDRMAADAVRRRREEIDAGDARG